jgi:hypothetical protein
MNLYSDELQLPQPAAPPNARAIPEEKTFNLTLQCASADCLLVAVHVPE